MSIPSDGKGLLSDEKGLHLLVLDALCLRELGPEFIGYEPEALFSEMSRVYGPIGTVTSEKLQACQLLHANDMFWTEWEVFEKVTNTIVGEHAVFSYTQPPDPAEVAVALTTASKFDSREHSEEVKRYIAACCLFEGLFYLEGVLDIATPFVDEYLKEREIEVDVDAVALMLGRKPTFFEDPESPEEAQVNKVLSIRVALDAFEKEVKAQLNEISR